jgi:signal transduction histidine kinase
MVRFRNLPIARELTVLNVLVSGATLLLALIVLCSYDIYLVRQSTVTNLSTQAQIIGSNTVSAILFDDAKSAEQTLLALRASPNILYAGIYTTDGQMFAEYQRDAEAKISPMHALAARNNQAHWFEGRQLGLVHSIVSDNKVIGTVYLRTDLITVVKRLRALLLTSMGLFLVCLIVALGLSRLFQSTISEPIVQLAHTAQIVSREKNYSVRAPQLGGNNEVGSLVQAFNEMLVYIQQRDAELLQARDELEERVQERTAELSASKGELEAFSYSVSHDLRAPLRSIDGFSQALLEDYEDKLDDTGKDQLRRVRAATQRMSALIDDLLNLARVTRSEMKVETVDLAPLAHSIVSELRTGHPERNVEFVIQDELVAKADPHLMRVVLENLLGNAWKYTSRRNSARVEVGRNGNNGKSTFFVRDDGAGFDPRYATRLFGAFQRLHSAAEFPGTGVGLATVHRIIRRHGGEIWAESEVQKGATFFFTLETKSEAEKRSNS